MKGASGDGVTIRLTGQPYDRRLHRPIEAPGASNATLQVDKTCAQDLRTYHALCHYQHQLFLACQAEVRRLELKAGSPHLTL